MCSAQFVDNARVHGNRAGTAGSCSASARASVAAPSGRSAGTLLVPALLAACVFAASAAPAVAQTGKSDKKTVAILYFDYTGNSEDYVYLRKALAQMLISDLAGTPGITIVERTRLAEVYAELDLVRTKRIDKRTALKVGKLLNAHYLIFGGYFFDSKGRMYITGRVTHGETGVIVDGLHERREGEAFYELEQVLAAKIRQILTNKVVAFADDRQREQRVARRKARRQKAKKRATKSAAKTAVASAKGATPTGEKSPGATVAAVGGGRAAAAKLPVKTAARYGKALDALDRGDVKAARSGLKAVVKDSPDFDLAAIDLASMAK